MLINTLEEFPAKKINSHNAEYQPEHDANQKNIGDSRYCMKQRAYYHLKDSIRTVWEWVLLVVPSKKVIEYTGA